MDTVYVQRLSAALSARGIGIEPGLSPAEIDRVQQLLGASLPPDARTLLTTLLPASQGFPDWRGGSEEELRWRCDGPVEGVLFDVEVNAFWLKEWGTRPASPEEAADVARRYLTAVPRLLPLWGHRYLPCDPPMAGNPVFSITQTDVIYTGNDLADYFASEFGGPRPAWSRSERRPIAFWTRLVCA